MAPLLASESTTFTLDNMGRFLCNSLQEALDSAGQTVGGRTRAFDTIIVGGGTFGCVVAEHLFIADTTRSRRILVLEAGPFVLPEHVQNMPYMGGAPDMRAPWVNHPALNYAGLLFAIGGRSLTWGGWSPELLDVELVDWPAAARAELRARYFAESSRQIGVKETNDFIYGPLHTALRKQLDDGLNAAGAGPVADAGKRFMIVPDCHVQELITETQPDNWVRVTGVRVWQNGGSVDVMLAPPRNGGQSAVVLALGTVETTRVARMTFQQSLAGRAADRMGRNLIAHLRSNLTIRVPRAAIAANLPPTVIPSLQVSALLVKGKAANGRTYHFQITASGLNKLGVDSEAELFKKIPTLEDIEGMLRATDDTVVLTIRGIGEMTPPNPDNVIDLSTFDTDFGRPKAVVSLGNAKATPQQFPGSPETNADRATWDEMDAVSDKIALIFAGNEAFDVLASANRVIKVPTGTRAERLAALAAFKDRRDDLGTTHHDAGTMRMGNNIADAVTNDFGRVHDTTNCYVAGPSLFPTSGSPNPMLSSVALARRTADLLDAGVLPGPDPIVSPQPEAGFRPLFDGTAATFARWRLAGPSGGGMAHINGEMVSYGDGGLRLFFYAPETFGDFTLRAQFKIFDPAKHNSGVFLRFPNPKLDLADAELQRRASNEAAFDPNNPAWKPVITGFEVQVDDNAIGDSGKDFYGIRPEPNGLYKNRTGAIYKIQAGDRIWHLNTNEPAVQNYTPGPPLIPSIWFEYEIVVQGTPSPLSSPRTPTGWRKRAPHFIHPAPSAA